MFRESYPDEVGKYLSCHNNNVTESNSTICSDRRTDLYILFPNHNIIFFYKSFHLLSVFTFNDHSMYY